MKNLKALTGILLPLSAVPMAHAQEKPINIIYILADDLGYGDISALNPEGKISTPNIDALANEGISFTDAHSSSSVSTPSRYSILTGRYNWRSTMQSGVGWSYTAPLISPERMTVATLLKDNGYNTACIGKWHLGLGWQRFGKGENDVDFSKPLTKCPKDNGFIYSYVMPASLDIPPYVYIENGRFTAPINDSIEGQNGLGFWRTGPIAEDFDINTTLDHFTGKATDYIKENADAGKPFFLYFPLTAPHTPILPSKQFAGKSGVSTYADFVMHVDDVVGRVMATVRDAGIEENTMIIFSSDNGFAPAADLDEQLKAGHHPSYIYRGHKADIYDGGHRVPYIVKCPDVIKRPRKVNSTVCYTNLMATCADMVGVKLPDNAAEDSFSMWNILKDGSDGVDNIVIHHSIDGNFSVRDGRWKLCLCPGSGGWSDPKPGKEAADAPKMQLFDMQANPSESPSENLVSKYPEVTKRLTEYLIKAVSEGRTTKGTPQKNDTEIDIFKIAKQ